MSCYLCLLLTVAFATHKVYTATAIYILA